MKPANIPPELLPAARSAAIAYLEAQGYPGEAALIKKGEGDDFLEVRIAAFALNLQSERLAVLEAALGIYARKDFWRPDEAGLIPAESDDGRVARDALAGRAIDY